MHSVLYVDDDPELLDLSKIFLEMSGQLCVDTAASVTEALEKLRYNTYDGIISDYQMPGINGIEFLRYIRQHYKDLPFVLFTGRGREEIVIEALNSGADFYLQKGGEPKSQFTELEYKIRTAIDRRCVQDELRDSRKQLSDLINFLPDATFAIDLKGRIIVWNRMMEELTGVPPDAVLGTRDSSWALPLRGDRRSALAECIVNADEEPEKQFPNLERSGDRFIAEMYHPSLREGKGAHFWLTASPLYNSTGNVVGAIESIRDITQRRETEEKLKRTYEDLNAAYEQLTATEEELRQNYEELAKSQQDLIRSEERYRNVVEDQTEFICRFTPEGKLTFVNDAYCRYFGLDQKNCMGKHHSVILPPEDIPRMEEQLSRLSRENPVAVIDHRIIMPNGEVRWQHWSDRAIFDRAGRVIEYQSVGRDITGRKSTEKALYEANRKLNLLSSITRHDILNQLTVLQGSLGLIEMENGNPDHRQWILKAIHASEVIRSQISFTRQYQDIGVQEPRWQNLHVAVTTVCMDDGFNNVSVERSLANVEIFADPLLRTVFSNLFENTAMHGGRVTRIQVSGAETPEGFTILVEDDGDGVAPEDKERIFRKGVGRHTGLGLFLVQEVLGITELSIRETGEFGKGARFEIIVPKGMFRTAGAVPHY
jgi:PAS domain S-box-containing protein